MKRKIHWITWTIIGVLFAALLFWGLIRLLSNIPPREPVTFGVTFSKEKAESLGLDWRETYLAILDELRPPEIRLLAYWNTIEPEPGQLTFADLDWQLAEAGKRGIKVLMAVGYKLPGWPECHVPDWAREYSDVDEQYAALLRSFPDIIDHLRIYPNIWAWQVENEPFFRFGDCPTWWIKRSFIEAEIATVRSLDARPVVVTEAGEIDLLVKAAKRADIAGASVYRRIWNRYLSYAYPFTPTLYRAKAGLVHLLYDKAVLLHEVQAEPWSPGVLLKDLPISDQYRTMSPEQFAANLTFVREIGLSPAYLWGAEWWYWMKENGVDSFWNQAGALWP